MDMKKRLEKRIWPIKPEYKVEQYNPSIQKGRMVNRPLRLHQSISETMPPDECAITSLCCGKNGKIYGATSGNRSHLFYYDYSSGANYSPGADGICDIGIIEGATSIKNTLVAGSDGKIWGGVSEGTKGYLFSYNTDNDSIAEFFMFHGKTEKVTEPVPGENICGLVIDKQRNILYGISSKSGTLFAYDIEKKAVSIKGQIDKNGLFSTTLVIDNKGHIYCCGAFGYLFKYNPAEDVLKKLSVSIPTVAGRSFYNRLQAGVYNKYDGFIYGGGSADGVLFAFNPENNFMRTIGKVTAEAGCPALTVGNDGAVYGISGEKDGMAHLFCYEPDTYSLADLGMPFAASEIYWHGYEFSCACTGLSGEIYLGESDRISHLFIYFPPVPEKKLPQAEQT